MIRGVDLVGMTSLSSAGWWKDVSICKESDIPIPSMTYLETARVPSVVTEGFQHL